MKVMVGVDLFAFPNMTLKMTIIFSHNLRIQEDKDC